MKKVSNIKERIKEFAENIEVTQEVFFETINNTSSNFRGKKLKTGVNADLIEKIVSLYPDIDLHWLITGEEKKEEIPKSIIMEMPKNYEKLYYELLEENRNLSKKVFELLELNNRLKKYDNPVFKTPKLK